MKVVYETTAPCGTTECRKGDVVRLSNGTSFFNGREQSPSRFYTSRARLAVFKDEDATTLKFF